MLGGTSNAGIWKPVDSLSWATSAGETQNTNNYKLTNNMQLTYSDLLMAGEPKACLEFFN